MSGAAVTVIIPTFNRPEGLLAAVQSVFAQAYSERGFSLVIVDNAPDGSAEVMIQKLRQECPEHIEFIALHEPQSGVANARNMAMSAVQTDLVAFLDDDQTAPEGWLGLLLENHSRFPAAVTFGPVQTVLPDHISKHRAYYEHFFARDPGLASGYTSESYGCGNALMDFSLIPGSGPWFDTAMNEIGGEDDLLFEHIQNSGGRFAWSSDAKVFEYPLSKRINLTYTLRRAFSYGQGPVTTARMASPPRPWDVLKWMTIGLCKSVWHGVQWGALSLVRHPNRAFQLDKALRGAAKVLWFVEFEFYGQAAMSEKSSLMTLFKLRRGAKSVEADADELV